MRWRLSKGRAGGLRAKRIWQAEEGLRETDQGAPMSERAQASEFGRTPDRGGPRRAPPLQAAAQPAKRSPRSPLGPAQAALVEARSPSIGGAERPSPVGGQAATPAWVVIDPGQIATFALPFNCSICRASSGVATESPRPSASLRATVT